MTAISLPIGTSMGATGIKAFPQTQYNKIKEMIDKINSLSIATGTILSDVVTPKTAGAGTSTQAPTSAGTAYASPTVLTASQSGAICLMGSAAGNVYTLPAATAANVGVNFTFIQTATVTSNASVIQGASASDLFVAGSSITQTKGTTTPTVAYYSPNGSSNYKVSGNGTTTGGIKGDTYFALCTGLNSWLITGKQSASASVATPFAG